MKRIIRFFKNFYLAIVKKNRRFLRLTPNTKGKIFFFDKKCLRFFSVYSRGLTDSVTADQIYTFHDYNLTWLRRFNDIQNEYKKILSSEKECLIIDCGANIGLSARYFSQEFPDAKVIAVEPSIENVLMAKKNCSNLDNIEFRHAAIGSVIGHAAISNTEAEPNSYRTVESSSEDGIEMISVNQILDEHENYVLLLTKVDVEGFEKELFSQNTDWVEKSYALVVELHDWMLPGQANSHNFLRTISALDRDFIFRGENIFSISNDTRIN